MRCNLHIILSRIQRHPGNGVYAFVLDGEITIADEKLAKCDAIGLTDISDVPIQATADSQLLAIEVPMQ